MNTNIVEVRYFDNFKGEKTLLFYGSKFSLEKFAIFMRMVNSDVLLNKVPLFHMPQNCSLELKIIETPYGMKKMTPSTGDVALEAVGKLFRPVASVRDESY